MHDDSSSYNSERSNPASSDDNFSRQLSSDDNMTLVPKAEYQSPSLTVDTTAASSSRRSTGSGRFGSPPPSPVISTFRSGELPRSRKRKYKDDGNTNLDMLVFSSPDRPSRSSWLRK